MPGPISCYRRNTGATLYSFGDPIGDVPILGMSLAGHQEAAVRACGGTLVDVDAGAHIPDERCVVFDDDVFFTPRVLELLFRAGDGSPDHLQVTLGDNSFNERFALPRRADDDGRYELCLRVEGGQRTVPLVLPQEIAANVTRMPTHIVSRGDYHVDMCDAFVTSIASPFHLLQANMAMNVNRALRLRSRFPDWLTRRLAPPNTGRYFRALRSINRFGRECRIHPTAVVEGAVLGDNVTVGAYAVVRLSTIGSGSTVEDQASVTYSVLGENNYIANKNHINFCACYDDVLIVHGPYQFSIFGHRTAAMGVINCDFRVDDKNIRIPTASGIVDSRQRFLGVAYGHGSMVAGGNVVAPGRIVPNELRLVPPDFMVTGFDE